MLQKKIWDLYDPGENTRFPPNLVFQRILSLTRSYIGQAVNLNQYALGEEHPSLSEGGLQEYAKKN